MATEEKSLYFIARKERNYTREIASLKISKLMIPPDRLEKIENRRVTPHPDEILALAEAYDMPELINYYCHHDCEIGREYVDEVIPKDLPRIAIETVNSLNRLNQIQNRLLEIVEDGKITPDELKDFTTIKDTLDKIVSSANSLQLWIRKNGLG